MGPSPRVRGSRRTTTTRSLKGGSIPACAGEPAPALNTAQRIGVHPRVCGGAGTFVEVAGHGGGPSPRVRGSRASLISRLKPPGSIPACAGEPRSSRSHRRARGVHPRVCGGAALSASPTYLSTGPSPRVRGSRVPDRGIRGVGGSIPACAGEPRESAEGACERGVHPRVCGGARNAADFDLKYRGPSPRVRGSRTRRESIKSTARSIPACAGEPARSSTQTTSRRVHPRVCGGATRARQRRPAGVGPSPRVRGSRRGDDGGARPCGSIPACAGEPSLPCPTGRQTWVHPRVCGGAEDVFQRRERGWGPSPRVRGSRRAGDHDHRRGGSIPACAGEPLFKQSNRELHRVHPRVCGGARVTARATPASTGPSPRVRGSLDPHVPGADRDGSIPACAGEPSPCASSRRSTQVHPRVCGGAPILLR